jgi:predicted N-acetyltransferase YhbS
MLTRDEIDSIWSLDRSEIIDAVYHLEKGSLVLRPEHYNMTGWLPGTQQASTPHLLGCFDHGGWFYALFMGARLAGVAVLENRFIGEPADMLQLVFLHVDSSFRDQGLGTALFRAAAEEARRRGARRLYVSATPSEHTIHFYLGLGCTLAPAPDPELLALEPDDIHLEYALTA